MKRLPLLLAAASIALLSSAMPFRVAPALGYRLHERLTIYEAACLGTETPPELLRAIARVESSERDDAIGDDGESIGRFQDRKRYHAYRESLYGSYDPTKPAEVARVYALELSRHFAIAGDWDIATAAHRQGLEGARSDGPTGWYLERVRSQL
ncbi:MAG: hypothetical protein JNG85_14620 [Spirochaetaceae bacterium]|nr:hypothetical protein [Spirochaetaceae bacterium]